MREKTRLLLIVGIGLLILSTQITVYGTQVRSVETEGEIAFTGVYEPIGTPDPVPPDTIAKPPSDDTDTGGAFPQTNGQNSTMLSLMGLSLIGLFGILWKKKRKELHQNN